MLKLYNSLTKKKEIFLSLKPKEVSLYVCGITPYDTTHLGHASTYISFDILVRVLKQIGYKVNYTQNVTDINDRDNDILKKAKEQNISWQKLARYWTKRFLEDMKALNWIMPNNYLKASENIKPMISLIQKLIDNGYAYSKNNNVYFDISHKKDYGKLSGLNKTEMAKKAKEFEEDMENPDKKNSLDFTLWKASLRNQPAHIPSFDSPFGPPPGGGRPGWHIECSSMSTLTLGSQIDIHGGGIDLVYPHHEAEIAQSEGATGKIPFSKFWMHVAQVSYQGKKMSKSLGNVIMVSDLLKKYSADVIRWYIISRHYRMAFEFFEKDLEKSKIEFSKILKYINSQEASVKFDKNIFSKFINALEDDLNTPLTLNIIKEMCEKKGSGPVLKKCLLLLGFLV